MQVENSELNPDSDLKVQKQLVQIHLKNDLVIEGVIRSCDNNLNLELIELNQASLPPQF
eukprot:CAMPEP_0168622474 /NCGR_PEP_ID=MMETSP0449_2-20121227/8289_1 /TAXON_ID=1082188 /ORGANISM="Strombidium rassoulzadegani, Strain ras09" /LENGTH=58 /DNA_ID=CAMNT_0008663747 /DNA_START=18 /DNA_END=194 /DNA_ORIENTATION=+